MPNALFFFFFFNDTATTEIYTLSLHDALPISNKIKGELRYHTMHADIWIKQLGRATEESVSKLQDSLDRLIPYAIGVFEPSPMEDQIIEDKIFEGEGKLRQQWEEAILVVISKTSLNLPDLSLVKPVYGGRDRKSTRLNSSHPSRSRMPSSA